jgi:hypothetical protein
VFDDINVHNALKHRLAIVANAIIESFGLRIACDYRIYLAMATIADNIIDALGGTSAVARMIDAPISTVHSWRKSGIPPSRLAHIKLAVQAEGKELPEGASPESGAA